jgi:hypothetical protein
MITTIFANPLDLFAAHCGVVKKWGLMISFPLPQTDEEWSGFHLACPYHEELPSQAIFDGRAFLLFDTKTEMLCYFNQTVGDDGPTKVNPYNGDFTVFAVTCSPEGKLLSENT